MTNFVTNKLLYFDSRFLSLHKITIFCGHVYCLCLFSTIQAELHVTYVKCYDVIMCQFVSIEVIINTPRSIRFSVWFHLCVVK